MGPYHNWVALWPAVRVQVAVRAEIGRPLSMPVSGDHKVLTDNEETSASDKR